MGTPLTGGDILTKTAIFTCYGSGGIRGRFERPVSITYRPGETADKTKERFEKAAEIERYGMKVRREGGCDSYKLAHFLPTAEEFAEWSRLGLDLTNVPRHVQNTSIWAMAARHGNSSFLDLNELEAEAVLDMVSDYDCVPTNDTLFTDNQFYRCQNTIKRSIAILGATRVFVNRFGGPCENIFASQMLCNRINALAGRALDAGAVWRE